MRLKIPFLVLIIVSFSLFTSCKKEGIEWEGSIEEENGVMVVRNPDKPIYGEEIFSLQEELSIGEAEGREEYMFSEIEKITSIAVDDEERIYVLDYKENNVKIYDAEGRFIKKFGRQGQGPGEFFLPDYISISNQDEIIIKNIRSISYFSLEGEYKRSLTTNESWLLGIDIDTEGFIYGFEIIREEDNQVYELKKFDSELNYLHSLGSSPLPSVTKEFNPFFPILRWDILNGDQIVTGYMKEYELKVFDSSGNLLKRIIKEYTPVEVREGDVEERLEGEELPLQLEKNMVVPKYHCPFHRMSGDDSGKIFVWTYERVADGDGYYYDVFEAEGKYMAKVPLKSPPYLFKNGKLYTVEKDEDGFQFVKRYKVNWQLSD